jgi:endo-1,4-beta-xylanase
MHFPTRLPLCLVLCVVGVGSKLCPAEDASPGLRELGQGRFQFGVGVEVDIADRPQDWELLTRHFEILTPENCMKPVAVQPAEGEFHFEATDRYLEFAEARNLNVVGHCLVWAKDDRTPEWFFRDGDQVASRELLLARMKAHIDAVAGRYRGRIAEWDVVNEALADGADGYLRDSGWSRALGEEFIVKAFEYAHAADPDAVLIYNDYHCDTEHKRAKLLRLARMLKDRQVPVDVIGLQGHYELDAVPYEGLATLLEELRTLGFRVVVSELDIDVVTRGKWWAENGRYRDELATFDPYKEGCPPEILARQAEQYARLFELFVEYDDVIDRVSFWNLHDGQSWLNYFPWSRVNHPLLFDREGGAKPAYDAVRDVLVRTADPSDAE